jgi:hypothetical protein
VVIGSVGFAKTVLIGFDSVNEWLYEAPTASSRQ